MMQPADLQYRTDRPQFGRLDRASLRRLVVEPPVSPRTMSVDLVGTTSYTFDGDGRQESVTNPAGKRLTYTYDKRSLRQTLTDPDGGVFTTSYDGARRLSTLQNPQGELTTNTFDANGRRTLQNLASGARVSWTYDAAGQTTQLFHLKSDNSVIASFDYAYDEVGNPTRVIESDSKRITYSYDAANQLTGFDDGVRVQRNTYTYDPVGNRTREQANGAIYNFSATLTYDLANQQTQHFDGLFLTTYTYDGAGNQLQFRSPIYTGVRQWDDENRPTRDQTTLTGQPAKVTSMTYDGGGLLVKWEQGSTTNKQIWDGQRLLLETDGSNSTQAVYTLEPLGFGNLVSMRRLVGGNWTRRYYHFNNIGTTDRLTDETQTVTDRYQLDPWGKLFSTTGTTVNPYRYIGKLGYYHYGTATGLELYYVRARHYDPLYGRWWSRDPIDGFRGDRFAYVFNQPTLAVDPDGQKPSCFVCAVCAGAWVPTVLFVCLVGCIGVPPGTYQICRDDCLRSAGLRGGSACACACLTCALPSPL